MIISVKQLDRVIISKSIENSSTDWIVIMRYGDLVEMTELSDPESITVPPHDVFCKSDKQVIFLFCDLRADGSLSSDSQLPLPTLINLLQKGAFT